MISYKLLGTQEWFVVHHTGCGMEFFTEDVQRIRNHPLVPARIPIYGYLYGVKSGRLNEVPDATKAGQAA